MIGDKLKAFLPITYHPSLITYKLWVLSYGNSTFIITREDRAEDAKTLVTEGLRIGRQNDCDLVLNHPTVSRLHAGINRVGRRFYIINLSGSNATTLNGRLIAFDETEAMANGDQIRIGPFFLLIEQADERSLKIRVSHQFALTVGDIEARETEAVQTTAGRNHRRIRAARCRGRAQGLLG